MGCTGSKEAVTAVQTKQEEYDRMLKEVEKKQGGFSNMETAAVTTEGEVNLGSKPVEAGGKKTAQTPVRLEDGGKYLGEWKGDLKHGKGRILYSNGTCYEGCFEDGNAQGQGYLRSVLPGDKWVDYKGSFKDNLKDGEGELTFADGGKCQGTYKSGKKSGHWIEEFATEGKFEGNYEDGVRCGQGSYSFPDGCKYNGMFSEGHIRGWGRHEWPDGRVYKGEWLDEGEGQMHGVGAFYWPGGRKYVGYYESGKKEGYGIFTWPEGKAYKGYWHNGFQEGFAEFKHHSGETRFGEWKAGKRVDWVKPSQVKEVSERLGQSTELPDEDKLLTNMPEWLKALPCETQEALPGGKENIDDDDVMGEII